MKKTLKLFFAFILTFALLGSFSGVSLALADSTTSPNPNSAAGTGSSYNWAGYTATGGTFTGASGSWIIPAPTASGNLSADAEWIGIGGISGQDLIQVGTQTIFSGTQPTYQAWYETLPNASQNIAMAVKPGDQISASIILNSNGQWIVSMSDANTLQNFQTVLPYRSSESSAEWVVEMPTQTGSGFIPLDNFGTAQFTGATATKNGYTMNLSALGAQPMTMMSTGGQALATPSALGYDGTSFSVTRSSVVVTPQQGFSGFGRGGFRRQGNESQGYTFRPGRQQTQQAMPMPGMFTHQRQGMFGNFSFQFSFFRNK